jgi:nucleotide-binding universal stress UspA family protein
MNGKVLVATDGRPHSERAVQYAMAYTLASNSKLFAIYIVSPKAVEDKEKNIKNGMRVLGRMKIRAAELGLDFQPLLEAGHTAETIVEAADRLEADLIVIGKSEQTSMGKILGGSTSGDVFKLARCALTLVR